MSGICPIPKERTVVTYDDTPPARDEYKVDPPQPLFNYCEGGTNTTVTIAPRPDGEVIESVACCTVPGPAGPQGVAGVDGVGVPAGGTAGQILAKIDGTDYNTQWINETLIDPSAMKYKGYWDEIESYQLYDVVTHNGQAFVCVQAHDASEENQPVPEDTVFPGGTYWNLLTEGIDQESGSFLTDLISGTYDFLKDAYAISPLLGIAAGVGVVWAGVEIADMLSYDPQDPANDADQRYNGSPGFNGAYTQPTLPDLVGSLCDFAGIVSYDTSLLPATPINMTINSYTSIRNVLTQLSLVYQFDMVDSEGTLKFVPRALAPAKVLTYDDIGYSDGDDTVPYTAKRHQSLDLPKSVSIAYYSSAIDHNPFVQKAEFFSYDEGQDIKVSVPFTMDDSDAKEAAEQILVNSHVERTNFSFSTTIEHVDIEPGDVITLPFGDVRILEVNEEIEGILTFVATSADFNTLNYQVANTGVSVPTTQTNVAPSISFSQTLFLEAPTLDSTDNSPRLLLAPHGYGAAGWPGCTVYRSDDGGSSYQVVQTSNREATVGMVANGATELPPYSTSQLWDETSTVTVQLKTGELSSITEEQAYFGKNMCLIGGELIIFRTATLVGADTYELSGLLRGRRGTEYLAEAGHANQELFVLLDDAVLEIEFGSSDVGRQVLFKTVTIGSSLTVTDPITVRPIGENSIPWTVGGLTAVNNSGNWDITWKERPRLQNTLTDFTDVMHDPDFAGFNVAILDPNDDNIVIRTFGTTTQGWTYTQSQQVEDFGSAQGSIRVQVQQLSNLAGPGRPVKMTF